MSANLRVVNGQHGGVVYGDTELHTFVEDEVFNLPGTRISVATELQVLEAAKFHTLTGNVEGLADETEGSAVEVPAGVVLKGEFRSMQLHSGTVLAYRPAN